MIHRGDTHLFEAVGALDTIGGFADLLDGRQEQADEDANDGDDDEEFDQGEGAADRRKRPTPRHSREAAGGL